MGGKTNQQVVIDLMSFGPRGPLSELFVLEALRRYAADVAAAPPLADTPLLSGEAWRVTALHIQAAIDKHLGRVAPVGQPEQASEDEAPELPKEVKAKAVAYVDMEYCASSDDNIETDTDADSPDSEFSVGEDGIWVKGWLFCPKSVVPELYPEMENDDD